MRTTVAVSAALAIAALALPTGAGAQVPLPPQTTVISGTLAAPPPAPDGSSATAAFLRATTFPPVCETRREQFTDSYGWRVRDVRICR